MSSAAEDRKAKVQDRQPCRQRPVILPANVCFGRETQNAKLRSNIRTSSNRRIKSYHRNILRRMHYFRLSFSLHAGWKLPIGEQSFTFYGDKKKRKLSQSGGRENFDFIVNGIAILFWSRSRDDQFFSRSNKVRHARQEFLASDWNATYGCSFVWTWRSMATMKMLAIESKNLLITFVSSCCFLVSVLLPPCHSSMQVKHIERRQIWFMAIAFIPKAWLTERMLVNLYRMFSDAQPFETRGRESSARWFFSVNGLEFVISRICSCVRSTDSENWQRNDMRSQRWWSECQSNIRHRMWIVQPMIATSNRKARRKTTWNNIDSNM